MKRPRLVLFAGPGRTGRLLYNALKETFSIEAVVLESQVPRKSFLARRVKRLGWIHVLGQVCFRTLAVPLLSFTHRRRLRELKKNHRLSDREIPLSKVRRVDSINDSLTVRVVQEVQPQAIVLAGTRLLTSKLLAQLNPPILNIHTGITPLYRGVHGGYWALAQSEPEHCGVTVHLVDKGIDTGGILAQAKIHPTSSDCFVTYPTLQLVEAIPLLTRALVELADGEPSTIEPPSGRSRLWSHPTLFEYVKFRLKTGVK